MTTLNSRKNPSAGLITADDIRGKPGTPERAFSDLLDRAASGKVKVTVSTQWQDEKIKDLEAQLETAKLNAKELQEALPNSIWANAKPINFTEVTILKQKLIQAADAKK